MKLTPVRGLTFLMLLLCTGLVSLWFDSQGHLRSVSWTAPTAIAPDLTTQTQSLPGTISVNHSYTSIQERPLFAPDRRPPPPPPPPAPPDPFATIQVRGIFSGINAGILATVDGKTQRIKLNEKVGPWTLKNIDNRNVTFVRGADSRQLTLTYVRLDSSTAQSTQPPAASSAPVTKPVILQITKNNEDIARARLRNINEFRAAKGLPPIEK